MTTMPNWCYTNIIIDGPKKEVENLNKLLLKWTSTESDIKNDFGKNWLGNIVRKAGLDWEKVPCRGEIDLNKIDGIKRTYQNAELTFGTLTAWKPMHEMWHLILNKYAPHCNYTYLTEEWNDDLWETNDFNKKYFDAKIAIDCIDSPKEIKNYLGFTTEDIYYLSEEDFIKWGKEHFHDLQITYNETLKKLRKYIENYEEKSKEYSWVNIHEIEYAKTW